MGSGDERGVGKDGRGGMRGVGASNGGTFRGGGAAERGGIIFCLYIIYIYP
ncbi:MAG: hypothetical protein BWY17_04293 [Deltaproteobacteria bacterium ADurb.Bin207]|jgi:hypothetical protein|nr:MAG: hypothetical protein BWY17_04293 [Deltaproteobacteria bacterium ADurb.Bin207]